MRVSLKESAAKSPAELEEETMLQSLDKDQQERLLHLITHDPSKAREYVLKIKNGEPLEEAAKTLYVVREEDLGVFAEALEPESPKSKFEEALETVKKLTAKAEKKLLNENLKDFRGNEEKQRQRIMKLINKSDNFRERKLKILKDMKMGKNGYLRLDSTISGTIYQNQEGEWFTPVFHNDYITMRSECKCVQINRVSKDDACKMLNIASGRTLFDDEKEYFDGSRPSDPAFYSLNEGYDKAKKNGSLSPLHENESLDETSDPFTSGKRGNEISTKLANLLDKEILPLVRELESTSGKSAYEDQIATVRYGIDMARKALKHMGK